MRPAALAGALAGLMVNSMFNFFDFTPPLMPFVWWCFLFVNLILCFIFGRQFYLSFYRWLCDLLSKVFSKDSDPVFDLYGLYLFVGRVGTGKTISMVRKAQLVKQKFPRVKIYANFHTTVADGLINSWEDLLYITNIDKKTGINHGVLFLFDEIHLTFDSQSWKNAPANLLEYISLQRHFHKCIFGSSQVWSRVNKVLREQSDFVIECKTYFGNRLVRNTCFDQEEYNVNGDLKGSGLRVRHNIYNICFYASDRLRALYDTDEIVGSLFDKLSLSRLQQKFLEYSDHDKEDPLR